MSFMKKILFGASVLLFGTQVMAQVTFYEGEDFHGRAFTTTRGQADFRRGGFNDRASSVIVDSGRWEVCEDEGFNGECVLLKPGSYRSLRQMVSTTGCRRRVASRTTATPDTATTTRPNLSPRPAMNIAAVPTSGCMRPASLPCMP
jgi:hypothetical protein